MKNFSLSGKGLQLGIMMLVLSMSLSIGCSKDSEDEDTNNPSNTPGATTNTVTIEGMRFTPASITVPVGTKLTWTNMDAVTHDVTSTNSVFTSGALARGASFSYTFTAVGTYDYYCSIHPTMTGIVNVTAAAGGAPY